MMTLLTIALLMIAMLAVLGIYMFRFGSTLAPLLAPLVGIVFFISFCVVPQYWIGHYSLTATFAGLGIAVCISFGLVVWKNGGLFRRIITFISRHGFLLFILALLLAGLIYEGSEFAVPGGIDSAIHANLINLISLKSTLAVSYPLGVHLFVLMITSVFHVSTATALMSMSAVLYTSIFSCLYCVFYLLTGNRGLALLGMFAGMVDASAYNNYLNGSFTHVLGIALILSVVPLIYLARQIKAPWVRCVWWMFFFVTVYYIHFVTMLFILPALWLLRWLQRDRSWVYSIALFASMILGIPLFRNLMTVSSFSQLAVPAAVLMVVADVLVTVGYRLGHYLMVSTWGSRIAAALAVLGFFFTYKVFDVATEWYGPIIVALSFLGIVLILVKRDQRGYVLIYYSLCIVAIISLTLVPFISQKIALIKELVFYYGYSAPLMVLAGYSVIQIVSLVYNTRMRLVAEALILTLLLFIVVSRATNQVYFSPTATISRYAANEGFGVFYTRNDVRLAEWAKANLPQSIIVANPGGLYNSWAVLTGRQPMYYAYDQLSISGGQDLNDELQLLLGNTSDARPDELLDSGVGYVLLPENFSTTLFNPQISLLHSEGRSRLYQLNRDNVSDLRTYNLLNSKERPRNVSLEGQFTIQCPFCDNRLYYQFKETIKQLMLPSQGTVTIRVDDVSRGEVISLLTDSLLSRGEVAVSDTAIKSGISHGIILEGYSPPSPSFEVSIYNPSGSSIVFDSLVLLVGKIPSAQ